MSDNTIEKSLQTVNNRSLDLMTDMISNGKSENTRRTYRHALADFQEWFDLRTPGEKIRQGFSRPTVLAYIDDLLERGLAPATINIRIAALRQLAKELQYAKYLKKDLADAILDIKNIPDRGSKVGVWLTKRQAKKLLDTPHP